MKQISINSVLSFIFIDMFLFSWCFTSNFKFYI